ncbi:TetR/AcrR family transcriptional regulator [Nocardia sp. NPDC058518]|uniref:TetR/AcrR family transcriptional regulator n=1 Tax=Nocardia sp. NPDC058518 TaxID=3346534 RepID=UPI003663139B
MDVSAGARPRRRRAGGERRQAVLGNVVEILAERGYHNTRFQDVSHASGVAISTLQGYFGSREDMLVEALQAATDGEVIEMLRVGESTEDPWQRVVLLIDRGIDTPTPVWRMLMEFWTAAAHDDELRAHSIGLQARYRAPFETTLRLGVDNGVFHPKHDIGSVIDLVVAALDGLCFPRVLQQPYPEIDGFRAVLLDQLATTLGVQQ